MADSIRVWLHISGLRPLTWNESAYDNLVFPEERKNLLLSFVSNHKHSSEQNDDVIGGKGIFIRSQLDAYENFSHRFHEQGKGL